MAQANQYSVRIDTIKESFAQVSRICSDYQARAGSDVTNNIIILDILQIRFFKSFDQVDNLPFLHNGESSGESSQLLECLDGCISELARLQSLLDPGTSRMMKIRIRLGASKSILNGKEVKDIVHKLGWYMESIERYLLPLLPVEETIQPPDHSYQPLRHEDKEIRLLTLIPSPSDDATLRCTLSHVPLPKAPPYIALSYHWGDPKITSGIEVNGVKRHITVNLKAALQRLCAAGIYTIWADALCINQTDTQEKSLQVPRIGTIFRKASEVVIWLGNELGLDEMSMNHLQAGTTPELDQGMCLSTLPVFKHLLGRPYWRRVWIIQELAVASRISLYCGRYRIPWKAIDARCSCCQSGNFINPQGSLADENICRFAMLRAVRTDALTRQPIHLLNALHRTRSSLATDPRDKVFALLGLTYDGQYFVPEPSYIGSMCDSFTEFATSLLTSGQPLDLVYLRSSSRKVDTELPSWVPDWTDLNDSVAHRQFDCIMLHSAHSSMSLRTHEDPTITISGTELNVKGVFIDIVDGLGSALVSEDGPAFTHETEPPDIQANPYETEDGIAHIVYLTLESTDLFPPAQNDVSDSPPTDFHRIWSVRSRQELEKEMPTIVPYNLSGPLWTWLAENRSFMVHGQTIEWWTKRWSQLSGGSNTVQNEHRFLNTVRSSMRLLMTKKGYLGWAHPQAQKGDKIAILVGCRRPVILRSCDGGHRIVGDACLSGQSPEGLQKMASNEEVQNILIL